MGKYKILVNGQQYKISMSDVTDYYAAHESGPTEDIIHYSIEIDEDNPHQGTIYAEIENPSQHTLYLIEHDRCYIAINCRNYHGHGPEGNHMFGTSHRKVIAHSSGLGRSSYRFHKHWSICGEDGWLSISSELTPVQNYQDIEIPIKFNNSWGNVGGYSRLFDWASTYKNPERKTFTFNIRLALLSYQRPREWDWPNHQMMRVYQSKSKVTQIAFKPGKIKT